MTNHKSFHACVESRDACGIIGFWVDLAVPILNDPAKALQRPKLKKFTILKKRAPSHSGFIVVDPKT